MKHRPYGPYERFIKRPLDCILAVLGLIILSPVFLVVSILVRAKLGTPVVFTQERPGKNEKIFKLYKFRTMTDQRGADGELLPDEQRLTSFGRALRSSSMDELVELINIIRGDMAIVGPRPLLVRYLPRYSPEQHKRHDVRPGLTGYAQVHGRNAVTWEDKFKMDVWYTEHVSFKVDAGIFFATIGKVLKREGISSETSATMEEFMGSIEE